MIRVNRLFTILSVLLCLGGCATSPIFLSRGTAAGETARENGFKKTLIPVRNFTLLSYIRIKETGKPLVIYIEGDGVAWESRSRISSDPTPSDPLVIRLAALDPSPNVAYLARPGQYPSLGASQCDPKYWTGSRFSQEVIEDMDIAVSRLRETAQAPSVSLIGYSGGAAVAVLVSAGRDDVTGLRTIAGNLDHEAVSKWNKVSPLKGSLDPIDVAAKIKSLPQRHFVAYNDRIVPVSAAESFAAKIGDGKHGSITIVKGTTHHSGWEDKWPNLLDIPLYGQ